MLSQAMYPRLCFSRHWGLSWKSVYLVHGIQNSCYKDAARTFQSVEVHYFTPGVCVHSHNFTGGAASLDSVRNIWPQYLMSFMQSKTCIWMSKIYTQTYTPNTIINKNISPFAACSVRIQWKKKELLKMIRTAKVPPEICSLSAQCVHIWMSQWSARTINFCAAAAIQSLNSHT